MRGVLCYIVLLAGSSIILQTEALAVMSVDLGSEFMKVAIVKPGVPMEIAINKESRRKTAVVVSMRNGERLFGDNALNTAVKYPDKAYVYFLDLLGKTMENPAVEEYKKKFPFYNLEADVDTNTVLFRHDEDTTFSPEELLAMILQNAKEIAENFAEQSIADVVVTVPPYFNQAERRAVAYAVELSGLKLLQLMSDNTAVALQFGIFRMKEFTNITQHYMIFDMGASTTKASIVAFQEVRQKNAVTGTVEKFPQLTVKGVGFDRSLGGLDFQLRLRDHLARSFNAMKKTTTDVFTNQRAMAKLLKEAGRLKTVLSANAFHFAQIENIMEDIDFKFKVTREELEEMCSDLFDRIKKVVETAFSSSEVTQLEISEVLLMGAGTRIPKIQEKLLEATGKTELGKSLNTDEASAIGAVYQAAALSKGFKVKKFGVRDATIFPIQVEFDRVKSEENGEETVKTVKRTLFGRNNPYPQKKVMTFNKHTKDFSFVVNYADLDRVLSPDDQKVFGSTHISDVSLAGVEAAFTAHGTVAEAKGVKAHFRVDESGLLVVDKVEALFEKAPPAEDEEGGEESTLSKLGNTISNFFGGGEKDAEREGDVKEEAPGEEAGPEEPLKPEEKSEKEPQDEKEAEEEKSEKQDEEKKEEEKKEEEKKEEEKTEKVKDTEKQEENTEKTDADKKEAEQEKKEEEEPKKEEKEKEDSSTKEGKTEEKNDKKEDKKDEKNKDEKNIDEKNKDKKEKEEKKPPKPTTIKEDIKASVEMKDMQAPSQDARTSSRQKIRDLKKKDEEKLKLQKAMNELETFIISTQEKLYDESWEKVSTEENREEIRVKCSEASDWLYEVDELTPRKEYEDKLKELKKLTKALEERVKEYETRPKAIEALNSMVNYSEHFLDSMKNFTGEEIGEQPFTQVEFNTLEKLITGTKDWNKTMHEDQSSTPLTERPKLLVEDIGRKIGELDREVKYLVNKAKAFRPKVKKEKEEVKKNTTDTKPESDDNSTKPETPDTIDVPQTVDDGEGVQMDIPPMPGSEEEAEETAKEKKKKKETEEEQEETLQLDGDAPAATEEDVTAKTEQVKEDTKEEGKETKEGEENKETHDGGEL